MEFKTIIFKKEENIATIILNRPERLNAVNDQLVGEFAEAIARVADDDEIRVLIITGSGRAFSAGADFRFKEVKSEGMAVEGAEDLRSMHESMHKGKILNKIQSDIILALQRLDKPTVAMINGDAVGGGFDIALACDIRIGSTNARFMVGYTKMGVVPDGGGTWLMPRVMGLGKALELILTGDFCDAEEAYRIGILNKLVAPEDLQKTTMDLACRLAKGPPIANRLSKLLVYKGLEMDLETALEFLSSCVFIAVSSQDHKEAIQAFAEKRPPVFKDR